MKKYIAFVLILIFILSSCSVPSGDVSFDPSCGSCADTNDDGICDICSVSVMVEVDIYSVNDLHGKLADGSNHIGVDELTTFLKFARIENPNTFVISAGDMWQGSAESNLTDGAIITDWMNETGFVCMTLGNHEYDWGEEPIIQNDKNASFPFLAINIYDRETDTPVDYCQPSVLVDKGKYQIGFIGAMGDCYSSIAPEQVEDVYFITGAPLTALVKAESDRLREMGADIIVYLLHDGYDQSSKSLQYASAGRLSSYYDVSLSDGYVDIVFEGHSHQYYRITDDYGVYHLQNGGDNKQGISHGEIMLNTANGNIKVSKADLISADSYSAMPDDPIVEQLLEKYESDIGFADDILGYNSADRNRNFLRALAAQLYYQKGVEEWGSEYDIVLGGGFLNVRSPGYLAKGDVTYASLQSLFPFDNYLTLCAVSGRDLLNKFFETGNDNYFIFCGEYGESVRKNIDLNETYYIIVDSYTSSYAPNNLTEIDRIEAEVFARDLLAEYAKSNGFK